jgi:hypothetical protein
MKTLAPTIAMLFVIAAFFGGLFFQRKPAPAAPQKLTLEEILSIRELHLVKHTYQDLFFVHRKNDRKKAIRAVVQIPVTITAHLNLKDIDLVYTGDSLRKIILPAATLGEASYEVYRMNILETRGFQVHAGKDLYPAVIGYFGDIIDNRVDSTRMLAMANRILVQAEAEGKMYVEDMLKTLGRADIQVTFDNDAKDQAVLEYVNAHKKDAPRYPSQRVSEKELETMMMGFLPLPR